jgi:hypothetical protein
MKQIRQTFLLGLFCILLPIALAGCGVAVFGEEDAIEDASAEAIIESGLSRIDILEGIISDSEAIISNSGSTSDEISEARAAKLAAERELSVIQASLATAYLETNDISTVEIILDIGDLAADSAQSSSEDNLFDLIDFGENVSTSSLKESLDMYNSVSVNALPEADQDAFELRKGIANTMMAVELVNSVYDVESESFIDQGTGSKGSLNNLVNPGGDISNLSVYATNAVSGFENSDSFSSDDMEAISKVSEITTDLDRLNVAAQDGTTVVINNVPYDFTGDDTADNLVIDTALAAIFGGE